MPTTTTRRINPARALLRHIAPVLVDPNAPGHPDIPSVDRFQIDFDGYKGITDLICGNLFTFASIDKTPLVSDQAVALLATRIHDLHGKLTTIGGILDDALEAHLDHRHPGWNDEEGAHGTLDIRFMPRLRIAGTITRRFVASRTSRL